MEKPGDWVHTASGRKRRPKWLRGWGWLGLVISLGAMFFYSWTQYEDYEQFKTVTVQTWLCQRPIPADPPADPPADVAVSSDCAPGTNDTQVSLFERMGEPKVVSSTDGTFVFERIPTKSPSLVLNLKTPRGTSAALLADATRKPPTPLLAFDGDAQGVGWSALFRPGSSDTFAILLGPATNK